MASKVAEKKGKRLMNESKEIKVITRRTAREGKFQTTLELSGVMNVEQFANWLATARLTSPSYSSR